MHLVPQPQPSSLLPPHIPPSSISTLQPVIQNSFFPHPQSLTVHQMITNHRPKEQYDTKSVDSSTGVPENRNAMSSPQAFTQVIRSKGLSEFSPRLRS